MPKSRLARISGTFLAPSVSKNRRFYSKQAIESAVTEMQRRLDDPTGRPLTMMSHHLAGDDSTKIAGRITAVRYDKTTGRATYEADVADTVAGRDIVALTTPDQNGRRYLNGVSIRGYWGAPVETKVIDGQQVETADSLCVEGIDFTKSPGVGDAGITQTILESVAEEAGQHKAIVEVADEAELILEDAPVDDNTITEADTMTSKQAATPGGTASEYADPGYQKDGKKRYLLNTKARALAAWRFVNMPANQKPYTAAQLRRIKGKIRSALKKFGVNVTDEAFQPGEALTEAVFQAMTEEAYASISADNGDSTLNLSTYGAPPEKLKQLLSAHAKAVGAAFASLDPDSDGDVDGVTDDDTDECANCGEEIPDDASFCPNCGTAAESAEPEVPVTEATASHTDKEPAVAADNKPVAEQVTLSKDELAALLKENAAETAKAVTEAIAEANKPAPPKTWTLEEAMTDPTFLAAMKQAIDKSAEQQANEAAQNTLRDLLESGQVIPARKGLVPKALAETTPDRKQLAEMGDTELADEVAGFMNSLHAS